MNVSLTPQLEAMIHAKVESGLYNNASEVVREALHIMEREEKLARLKELLAEGVQAIDEGRYSELTPERWEQIRTEARRRNEAGLPVSDAVKP